MFLSKKFFCPFQKGLYIRPRAAAIERIGLILDDSLNPTSGRGVIPTKNLTYLVTDAVSPAGIGRIWSQTPFPRRELDVFSHRRHFLGGNWIYLVTDAISSAGMRYIHVNDKHFLPLCVSTRQTSTETRQGKEERNLLYRPRGKGQKASADAPPPASRIRPCARIASINKLFN